MASSNVSSPLEKYIKLSNITLDKSELYLHISLLPDKVKKKAVTKIDSRHCLNTFGHKIIKGNNVKLSGLLY